MIRDTSEAYVLKTSARLVREWTPTKVRYRYQELWWCWDRNGYTSDMAEAGLYDPGTLRSDRHGESEKQVDPKKYPIDALVSRYLREQGNLFEVIEELEKTIQRLQGSELSGPPGPTVE